MKYFVYFLLDLRKPGKYYYSDIFLDHEPFYVGVSFRKERIDEHFSLKNNNKNKFKNNIIKKLKILNFSKEQINYIFKKDLTEKQAFLLETEIIKKIGRRDLKTGPLTNLDFGGIGGNGEHWKNRKHSEETKEKIRITIGDSRKGKLNANFGKRWTNEQKNKLSINKKNAKYLKGKNNPSKKPEVRKKLSETKLGLKNPRACIWILTSPSLEKFTIEGGIKRELKKYNLDIQNFKYTENKDIRKNSKGWVLEKLSK